VDPGAAGLTMALAAAIRAARRYISPRARLIMNSESQKYGPILTRVTQIKLL
jgi:hypothetical protein